MLCDDTGVQCKWIMYRYTSGIYKRRMYGFDISESVLFVDMYGCTGMLFSLGNIYEFILIVRRQQAHRQDQHPYTNVQTLHGVAVTPTPAHAAPTTKDLGSQRPLALTEETQSK